jgi:hypothetical protein
MDLIIAGPAGHILAAGVRQDKSGPQPDATALVGDGLMIRDAASGDTLLTVSAAHLSVQSVDLRDDVLMTARDFVLIDNLPEKGAAPAASPVKLNGSTIDVTIPASAPQGGTNVWVYIGGAAQPIVHQLRVVEAAATASEPLPLPSGDYWALVLAPGCRAAIVKQSIP